MHLPVAHYPHEQKSTCLPACLRIVLSYLRIEADELSLSRQLGTGAGGTPTDNFAAVEIPGVSIIAQHMDVDRIRAFLHAGKPVVVCRYTEPLPYWELVSAHAVVVVGYEGNHFLVNDLMFEDAPKQIDTETFLKAWDRICSMILALCSRI